MIGLLSFNLAMVLLGVAVATRLVPTNWYAGFLIYLHNIVGITVPTAEKVRMVALIWIASMLVIVDGLLFLLLFLLSVMH